MSKRDSTAKRRRVDSKPRAVSHPPTPPESEAAATAPPELRLFEASSRGAPCPVFLQERDGTRRRADAVRYFTLEQAAARFARFTKEDLREMWDRAFSDFTPEPTQEDVQAKWPGNVWEAYDLVSNAPRGWLVSERDDVTKLIAFFQLSNFGPNRDRLFEDACAVAERPAFITDLNVTTAWDLRCFGRLDSELPTPAEFYRMKVAPVGGPGGGLRFAHPLFPFCRFRLAKLVTMHNWMQWPAEFREREAGFNYNQNVVGIEDPDNGGQWSQIDVDLSEAAITF